MRGRPCESNTQGQGCKKPKLITSSMAFSVWLALYELLVHPQFTLHFTNLYYKVIRCLARYSPCHNHQPTHQKGTKWASNGQKCQFRAKFGCFGAKNPIFYWRNQSFVTPVTENPPGHLVHIGFWSGIGQNVQKMAIFGPKWPKMQILDQIWPFLGQKS